MNSLADGFSSGIIAAIAVTLAILVAVAISLTAWCFKTRRAVSEDAETIYVDAVAYEYIALQESSHLSSIPPGQRSDPSDIAMQYSSAYGVTVSIRETTKKDPTYEEAV